MKKNLKSPALCDAENKIKGMLDEKRFIHSIAVAQTAVIIAEKYGLDKRKAELAGLLHDCARDLSGLKQQYFIKKYKIRFDPVSKKIPGLRHSFLGAYVAMEEFNVKDREVLEAIKYHTAGNASMGPIAKAVYIADYTEINRKYRSSEKIRAKIKTNISLDEMVGLVLKDKLGYLVEEGKLIHKDSVDMWNQHNHNI